MKFVSRLELGIVEQRVCDIASEQLCIPRDEVRPSSRLIEDLRCDSLDLVELIMALEDEFLVTLPNVPTNSFGKSIFTRQPFRLSDLAEIVYIQQGSGKPERMGWRRTKVPDSAYSTIRFSQLSGRWQADSSRHTQSMFEAMESENGTRQFRRRLFALGQWVTMELLRLSRWFSTLGSSVGVCRSGSFPRTIVI